MRILIIALLFIASTAFAQTPIAPVFESTFDSNYQAGKCGINIMNLVALAQKEGLDISRMRIIQITNKGNFNFGMVGGFEARAYRTPPSTGLRIAYSDLRNWYHHVILEHDGFIYDYDFGTEPEILPVADYIERMFLVDKKWSMGNYITPRTDRLNGYQVEIKTAQSTLIASSNPIEILTLGQYLELFSY